MNSDPFETYNNFVIPLPHKLAYAKSNEYLMLTTAYMAITDTGNWDFITNHYGDFSGSSYSKISEINTRIHDVYGYDGHSGASFAITMRSMQYIAKHGEEKFRKQYLNIEDK